MEMSEECGSHAGENDRIAKIKRKVNLLLRHAGGTSNVTEAATFASKARSLMLEHGLSGEDINSYREDTSVSDVRFYGSPGMTWITVRSKHEPYRFLLVEVAGYYGCHVVFKKGDHRKARVFGGEIARETTCEVFRYFMQECAALARKLRESGELAHLTAAEANAEMVSALGLRLMREREVPCLAADGSSTALTISTMRERAVAFACNQLGITRKVSVRAQAPRNRQKQTGHIKYSGRRKRNRNQKRLG